MDSTNLFDIRKVFFLAIVLASVFCLSCSSSWVDLGPIGIPERHFWIFKYLPYIESIEMPETIRANEAFNITVRLSAVLKPEILQGLDPDKHPPAIIYDQARKPGIGIDLSIYKWDIPQEGAFVDKLDIEVPPLEQGDYFLKVTSADSREWGGLDLSYDEVSHDLVNPEHQKHRAMQEYYFTVLPPDEGDGA